MTLDLSDLDGFATVVVTSADVTGRPVGNRVSVGVFRRVVHEGIPLSSCVLGWDVDQWPGPVQEYTGHHTGWHDVRLVPEYLPTGIEDGRAVAADDGGERGRIPAAQERP